MDPGLGKVLLALVEVDLLHVQVLHLGKGLPASQEEPVQYVACFSL